MDFLMEHPYFPFLRRIHGPNEKSNTIFVQGDTEYLNEDIVSYTFWLTCLNSNLKIRAVLWNIPISKITIVERLGFALLSIPPIADFDKIFEVGIGHQSICLDHCACVAVSIPSTSDRLLLRPYKLSK